MFTPPLPPSPSSRGRFLSPPRAALCACPQVHDPHFILHIELEKDLAGGTMLCSPAAYCHPSTPIMKTYGARLHAASGKVSAALFEPILSDGEDGSIAMDLEAVISAVAPEKLARYRVGWEGFVESVSPWPAPAAPAPAGPLPPSLRDLDAIVAIMQQSVNGLAHIEQRRMAHRDIKPASACGARSPPPPSRPRAFPPTRPPARPPARPTPHPPVCLADIMLDGAHRTAKIIDYGESCVVSDAGGVNELASAAVPKGAQTTADRMRCTTDGITGTPTYYSPNMYAAYSAAKTPLASASTVRADLFDLGLSLLQVLVGRTSIVAQPPVPISLPHDGFASRGGAYTINSVMTHTAFSRECVAAAAVEGRVRAPSARHHLSHLFSLVQTSSSPPTLFRPTAKTFRVRAC